MTSRSRIHPPASVTAATGLEAILVEGARLPLRYWRSRFFFTGGRDPDLFEATGGRFPVTPVADKTHPVFAIKPLPDGAGCRVCPCSSKKPFRKADRQKARSIPGGCVLNHTGFVTDRRSYLIESVTFNIPASVARNLRFRGEVPETCIELPDNSEGNLK